MWLAGPRQGSAGHPGCCGRQGCGGSLREAAGRVSGWWAGLEAAAKKVSRPCPLPLTLTSWKEIPHCIWGSPILAVHRKCPFPPERQKASTDGLDAPRQLCVEGVPGRQIQTLADTVLLWESSQTTVTWLHWNEEPLPGQVPRPPLTAHLPTPLPEVPWEDECRGQNHSSFLTNPLVPNPDVLPVRWARPFVGWMSPQVWTQRHPSHLSDPFLLWSEVKWSEVAQPCLTLCDPMDCSLPGSSIHGIFQARVLEWGAISFSNAHTLILSLKILAEERQMLRKSHQGKHRDSFHSLNQWGLSCLPNKPCQSWGWGQGRGGSSESRWPGLDSTDTGTRKPGEAPCRAAVFPSAPTVYNQGQRKAGGSSQPIGPLWVTEAKWRLLRGDSVCRFWNRRRHGTKLAPAECLETGALDFSEAVWLPQSRLGWL